MWAVLVIAGNKRVEAGLLLEDVGRGRLGRFGLQREMHALVPAVLFGMPGSDPLDLNPESQPPDRQPAQAVERVG